MCLCVCLGRLVVVFVCVWLKKKDMLNGGQIFGGIWLYVFNIVYGGLCFGEEEGLGISCSWEYGIVVLLFCLNCEERCKIWVMVVFDELQGMFSFVLKLVGFLYSYGVFGGCQVGGVWCLMFDVRVVLLLGCGWVCVVVVQVEGCWEEFWRCFNQVQ